MNSPLRIGIVAGEQSGDQLGEDLICRLKQKYPHAEFVGIGGDLMKLAGLKSLYPMELLSVMGIVEILPSLFRILKCRRQLFKKLIALKIDLFIGIDSPDFNLSLEKWLKKKNIKIIHYVSPTIWAWRYRRIYKIKKAVDMVLTIFPFEKALYDDKNIKAVYVGHPMARDIPMETDKFSARTKLNLPQGKTIIGILPGSRRGEIEKLFKLFLETASLLNRPEILFVVALSNERFKHDVLLCAKQFPELQIEYRVAKARDVMGSADATLVASGTATLEIMLVKRPMVVAYKTSWITYLIGKTLIRTPYVSLPNIIANKALVPEFLQTECKTEDIKTALSQQMSISELNKTFTTLHQSLLIKDKNVLVNAISNVLM